MKTRILFLTATMLVSLLSLTAGAAAAPQCPGGDKGSLDQGGIRVIIVCPPPKPPPDEPFVPINQPPRPDPCATLIDRGNGLPVLIGNCLASGLLLPIPPAPGGVMAQVAIPTTQVNTSPTDENLVGWRTNLWYSNPGTVVAQVTITDANGFDWVGEARASVVRYTWRMGDDADADGNEDIRASNRPGTGQSPSAEYVYHRHCRCTITVVATWSGTYTLTEATTGNTYTNVSLGEHDFAVTDAFQAIEVEAVITR